MSGVGMGELAHFPLERTRPRRLVDLAELQDRFGFSTRWWRYRIAEDGFPTHRWAGGLRFDPDQVADWLDTMGAKRRRDAGTSGARPRPTKEA
jgi:hypothetical protein